MIRHPLPDSRPRSFRSRSWRRDAGAALVCAGLYRRPGARLALIRRGARAARALWPGTPPMTAGTAGTAADLDDRSASSSAGGSAMCCSTSRGYYLQNPAEILRSGRAACRSTAAFSAWSSPAMLFCRREGISVLRTGDAMAMAAPIGLLLRPARQFRQRRALGPPDRPALGRDLSRRGGAGLPRRRGLCARHPRAALRGGAGRAAPRRPAALWRSGGAGWLRGPGA